MIKRIVKLSFDPANVETFLTVFEESKSRIITSPGCRHLELLRDEKQSNVFFTYSIWETEAALNYYRHSEFFAATWKKTKALFNDEPQAWSLTSVETVKTSVR